MLIAGDEIHAEDGGMNKDQAWRWSIPVVQTTIAFWVLRSWYLGADRYQTLPVRICFGVNAPAVLVRNSILSFPHGTATIGGVALSEFITFLLPAFILWFVVIAEFQQTRRRNRRANRGMLLGKGVICAYFAWMVVRLGIDDIEHYYSTWAEYRSLVPSSLMFVWGILLIVCAFFFISTALKRRPAFDRP